MFRIRFREQFFPSFYIHFFVLLPTALAKSMECRHSNLSLYFVVKNLQKPSFYLISCLLPAYFRCQSTCVLNPQLVFALEFYKKKVLPRVVEGLWMGFPHPLYSSHCCHTFSNVRRVSHDHLNDRKSRPSLNMTILTPYR